jgi:hypothetical protein
MQREPQKVLWDVETSYFLSDFTRTHFGPAGKI